MISRAVASSLHSQAAVTRTGLASYIPKSLSRHSIATSHVLQVSKRDITTQVLSKYRGNWSLSMSTPSACRVPTSTRADVSLLDIQVRFRNDWSRGRLKAKELAKKAKGKGNTTNTARSASMEGSKAAATMGKPSMDAFKGIVWQPMNSAMLVLGMTMCTTVPTIYYITRDEREAKRLREKYAFSLDALKEGRIYTLLTAPCLESRLFYAGFNTVFAFLFAGGAVPSIGGLASIGVFVAGSIVGVIAQALYADFVIRNAHPDTFSFFGANRMVGWDLQVEWTKLGYGNDGGVLALLFAGMMTANPIAPGSLMPWPLIAVVPLYGLYSLCRPWLIPARLSAVDSRGGVVTKRHRIYMDLDMKKTLVSSIAGAGTGLGIILALRGRGAIENFGLASRTLVRALGGK